jgi:hypothetical protein
VDENDDSTILVVVLEDTMDGLPTTANICEHRGAITENIMILFFSFNLALDCVSENELEVYYMIGIIITLIVGASHVCILISIGTKESAKTRCLESFYDVIEDTIARTESIYKSIPYDVAIKNLVYFFHFDDATV